MAVVERVQTKRATFGKSRKWLGRLQLTIGVVLAFYILLAVNLISFRHPVRIDLTEDQHNTLSAATLNRLKYVNEEVRVLLPRYINDKSLVNRAENKVLTHARLLLNEYMAAKPRIKVVAELDVFAEPSRWQQLRTEYDLTASQVNRLIFVAGVGNTFRQTVSAQELAVFGETRDPAHFEPEMKEFRGEKAITDALTRLIERERMPVYFTQDKDELSLDPMSSSSPGLVALRRELETSGYEARPLELSRVTEIPADCRILFVVRPLQEYEERELERIQAYLQGGGRLFVALGPKYTRLETLLDRWAVDASEGSIVESRSAGAVVSQSKEPTTTRFHRTHPITTAFRHAARFEVRLFAPRPLDAGGRENGLQGVSLLDLLSNPEEGIGYYHREDQSQRALPKADDFSVAVAVSQFRPDRPPPNFQFLDSRIVVFGSASPLIDHRLGQFSHRDLVLNCASWLAGREDRASVGGQPWVRRTLKMNGPIRRFLFWVPIFLFPGVCMVMGIFVYVVRRA